MTSYIERHFIPVKIHIKEQPQVFERFGAQWTPTLVFLDPGGTEIYRFEGFLPAEDFLAELELALAKSEFAHRDWQRAEADFRHIVEHHPSTVAAPAALYWAGVSRYKASGDSAPLEETAAEFRKRYQHTEWAKKASAWAA